jgi:hypothetical protein
MVMKTSRGFQNKPLCCNINADNNLIALFMFFLLNKFSLWLAMGNIKRFAGQIRSELMLRGRWNIRMRDDGEAQMIKNTKW